MSELLGRDLDGRYRIVAELGEGAMGKVYSAHRLDGAGQVAVKVLNEDCSSDPDLRERFEREARALFGLEHPHILDVQDYGVIDGRQPYLVMEFLEGQGMDAMVDEGRLRPTEALHLGAQLLSGLAYAHSLGVLHRDLKSENVFVVRFPDGRLHAKLLDFGLVKFVDDERWGEAKKLTVVGSVMGSPAYMSPEQATGGEVKAQSDVYSAGVVLYELLTGTWPFMADSRSEMLRAHLTQPPPPLSEGDPRLRAHPALDAIIQKALAKDERERFVDASEMLRALQAVPAPKAWLHQPAVTGQGRAAGVPPVPAYPQAAVGGVVGVPPPPSPPGPHASLADERYRGSTIHVARRRTSLLLLVVVAVVLAALLGGGLAALLLTLR